MKITKFFLALFFSFLLAAHAKASLFSREIWLKESNGQRTFVILEKINKKILFKKYFQQKGEYQELIEKTTLNDSSITDEFKNSKLVGFIKVNQLVPWQGGVTAGIFKKGKPIWIAKNQWSDDWEIKFGNWIQAEVNTEFYKKYNLQTDCADALVGLRWIFARINSLPVANTLADSEDLFGNFSIVKKWSKFDTADKWYEDQLFMTALNYVMDLTSTKTVINDGYPIRLDRTGILPGSYIITQSHGSGHARTITETHFGEVAELPIYTLASTTPRQVRSLVKEVFADQEWPLKNSKEVLAFRWPIINKDSNWVLKPSNEHSRYSTEQFDLKLKEQYPQFILYILSKINDNFDPVSIVSKGAEEIVNYTNQRIDVVKNGYDFCSKNNCKEGTTNYDDWSTPSRDEKLLKKFGDIDNLVSNFEKLSPGLGDYWADKLRNTKIIIEGIELTLSQVRYLFEEGFTSINPALKPLERWGLNSDAVLIKWTSKIEAELKNREAIISKLDGVCSTDCFPKSVNWVEYNTYQVDALLNKYFVEMNNYCSVVGNLNCSRSLDSSNPSMSYSGFNKTLKQWIYTIPFFNSDPRVSLAQKWGYTTGKNLARLMPNFETMKVSTNYLALLDNRKIINLKTGKLLLDSGVTNRIVLTAEGYIFKINDSQGSLTKLNLDLNTDSLNESQVNDPANVLLDNRDRRIQYLENDGYGIFKKVLAGSTILFRIKKQNDQLEFINEFKGTSSLNGPLVFMADNDNHVSFADLNLDQIFSFDIQNSAEFTSANNLKVISYSFPNAILNYFDSDRALNYLISVDLQNKKWEKIELKLSSDFRVLLGSAFSKKILIQTKYNDEFPEIYAVNFLTSSNPTIVKMGNNLIDVKEVNGQIYIIQSIGSAWDSTLSSELYIWSNSLQKVSREDLGFPQYFSGNYIYYNKAQVADSGLHGTLLSLDMKSFVLVPKLLMNSSSFYNISVSHQNYFNYRFETAYGDYWNMGGGGFIESLTLAQESELIPNFTVYAWINKENLLDQRWQKSFLNSTVMVGTMVGIGRNTAVWWGRTE